MNSSTKKFLKSLSCGLLISMFQASSHAAQVDLGLTLGQHIAPKSGGAVGQTVVLSGMAVRLGTFSSYSDVVGTSFFTGKSYTDLFSAFTGFAEISSPTVLLTDNVGQIYQSYETGSTGAGVRMFAWLYDTTVPSASASWVIVSGGGNTSGTNASVYDPMWLAVAPTAGDINSIEMGTIYSKIYASKDSNAAIVPTLAFDAEGANILIPEPSSGALFLTGLMVLIASRKRALIN